MWGVTMHDRLMLLLLDKCTLRRPEDEHACRMGADKGTDQVTFSNDTSSCVEAELHLADFLIYVLHESITV